MRKTRKAIALLLAKKGFAKSGEDYFSYLLQGEELLEYFSLSDLAELIETGQIKAALLEVYPEEKKVNYILFEETPSEEDVAAANVIHEDDFDGFMEWLQQGCR